MLCRCCCCCFCFCIVARVEIDEFQCAKKGREAPWGVSLDEWRCSSREHRSGIVRQGKWTTSKLDESTDLRVNSSWQTSRDCDVVNCTRNVPFDRLILIVFHGVTCILILGHGFLDIRLVFHCRTRFNSRWLFYCQFYRSIVARTREIFCYPRASISMRNKLELRPKFLMPP